MSNQADLRNLYLATLSQDLRENIGASFKEGWVIVSNRISRTLTTLLGRLTEDPELAGIDVFFSLYSTVLHARMRSDFFFIICGQIIDDLAIDENFKRVLKLHFRGLDLDKITTRGHTIEIEKLIKEVPVIIELGLDIREELINKLRSGYSNCLMTKYANIFNVFLEEVLVLLEKSDVDLVLELFTERILKLNLETNKDVSFRNW